MIFVAGQQGGVFYHRLQIPYEDLLMRGFLVKFGQLDEIDKYKDVMTHLVVNRGVSSKNHRAFKAMLLKNNIKLILDIDDWWVLPRSHANRSNQKTQDIIWTLKIADEIHTTNAYLAEKVQKENPYVPIWILPNAIDNRRTQWEDIEKEDGFNVGYMGAFHHDEDLTYNRINLAGLNSYSIPYYKERLNASNEFERADWTDYGKLYKKIHVSIAPLAPSTFNKCKSNLKALEAGFTKTCIIAQDMHPYTPFLNENNSILCKGPAHWEQELKNLDPERCKALAEQLHKDVQFYSIENINNTRQQCYAS
jgi:hypothetical protein